MTIPKPSISRICMIYNLLLELEENGETHISSTQIGQILGIGAHSIRKDIIFLGDFISTGAKYDIKKLKNHISEVLNFEKTRNACIVGLGRLGTALLNYSQFTRHGYNIIAGFDSNVNKIETLKTSIKLYPAYEIPEQVKRLNIELAILAVPADAAQISADRLIEGGIKGIVNFSPSVIKCEKQNIFISNTDVVKEFRMLSAMIALNN